MEVPPGKSVSVQDVKAALLNAKAKASTSTAKSNRTTKNTLTSDKPSKEKAERRHIDNYSSDKENDVEIILELDDENETYSDLEETSQGTAGSLQEDKENYVKLEDFSVVNFAFVKYNGQEYPDKILKITVKGPTVECMDKRRVVWSV